MVQSYEVKESDLDLVKGTQFTQVRLQVCQQATLYNNVIAPFGQGVLQDTSNFF